MIGDIPVLQRIMVATDGSDTSKSAARFAIDLAKLSGAKMTAIFVADIARLNQITGYFLLPGIREGMRRGMIEAGEDALRQVQALAEDLGVNCDRMIVEGSPSDELLRVSLEENVDLLVMGSVGKGGLNRFLLGSVAEKVVEHTRVPVLIVPAKVPLSDDGMESRRSELLGIGTDLGGRARTDTDLHSVS